MLRSPLSKELEGTRCDEAIQTGAEQYKKDTNQGYTKLPFKKCQRQKGHFSYVLRAQEQMLAFSHYGGARDAERSR